MVVDLQVLPEPAPVFVRLKVQVFQAVVIELRVHSQSIVEGHHGSLHEGQLLSERKALLCNVRAFVDLD